jgi:hypothetical protein
MIMYQIQCRESGDPIEEFMTYEEAMQKVIEYESADEKEGIYEPNFYTIVQIEVDTEEQ